MRQPDGGVENLDIRNNQQLQDEFDKLVERVHDLEAIALEQGDGFTAQNAEPAPIDEANAVTFPVDPNVKAKAEAEIRHTQSDLPLMMTDQVASYINYFSTHGRASLESAMRRKGRYETMIRRVLEEEGVPQDLIYLAEAGVGLPADGPLARGCAGHVAVYGHGGLRSGAQLVGGRAAGSGEVDAGGGASFERFVRAIRRLVSGDGGV